MPITAHTPQASASPSATPSPNGAWGDRDGAGLSVSAAAGIVAGLVILAIAVIFYAVTDRTTASSVVFALILFVGFALIARSLIRR